VTKAKFLGMAAQISSLFPMHWLRRNAGRRVWLGLALLAIAAGILGLYFWERQEPDGAKTSELEQMKRLTNPLESSVSSDNSSPLFQEFNEFMAALGKSRTPEQARMVLTKMRAHLASLEPALASRTIREFLDFHEDASTHLGFVIGPNGFLLEAPSGRVFLLDLLAQVDRPAAAAYAEKILSTMTSSDEWAIALRNYALGNRTPNARAFLEDKVQQLLLYEPWQRTPSTGYLEAFDVAVYLGSPKALPALTTLIRLTENRAVSHAAYLALDRLTLSHPATVLEALQAQPEMLKGRETTCANYFARANVEDEAQKTILERYLLDSRRTASELNMFAGLFPNANYMISANLLTQTLTPDRTTLNRQDRRALDVVGEWLKDPRFEKLAPQLQTIRSRLEGFVNQTPGGPARSS
jgi:hypothetical protein